MCICSNKYFDTFIMKYFFFSSLLLEFYSIFLSCWKEAKRNENSHSWPHKANIFMQMKILILYSVCILLCQKICWSKLPYHFCTYSVSWIIIIDSVWSFHLCHDWVRKKIHEDSSFGFHALWLFVTWYA